MNKVAKKYLVHENNIVVSFTNADSQLASNWIEATDVNVAVGDTINPSTGSLVSKQSTDTQTSRKKCKDLVRQVLRDCDWTQVNDNLGVGKQNAWKTYRQAVRDNWTTAKSTNDPLANMVWPDPPGSPDDGL